MKYTKTIGGAWAKGSDLASGTKAKIVSETVHSESQFKDKNGAPKFQDVAKVRFDGKDEAMNVNLNRATLYGLIDAFGEESKEWINKPLTVHTERRGDGANIQITPPKRRYWVPTARSGALSGTASLTISRKGRMRRASLAA